MAGGSTRAAIGRDLGTLFAVGAAGALSDGQLLRLSQVGGGEAARSAFATLIDRHGPMVLRVCRRGSAGPEDAEDAFQATFLVLAHKAGSVRQADSLASWLHGVALRVARRARMAAARRAAVELRSATTRPLVEDRGAEGPGSWPELHEEIARLPPRYREPVVLCYLEGVSTEEAARRLRCPRGTVLSRLSRARERLRRRLVGRGVTPAAATACLAAAGAAEGAGVVVAPAPAGVGAGSAARAWCGPTAGGPASAAVLRLARGVLRTMFWTRVKSAGLVGLASAGVGLAVGASAGIVHRGPEPAPVASGTQDVPQRSKPPASRLDRESAIFAPLPPAEELHRVLRQVAAELVGLAKEKPATFSRSLTTIAGVQAGAGDRDGARATFAEAVREAAGEFGGEPSPWALWRIGHFQAEAGLGAEALATLKRAVGALPGPAGDPTKDSQTVNTLVVIAQEQAVLGSREEARETADRLLGFTRIGPPRPTDAPGAAAALAAVGDFAGAFRWADGLPDAGNVVGKIAEAAARCLSPDAARPFLAEAAERLAKLKLADLTYFGLSDLAEAQARIGEVDAARRSARRIGEGPARDPVDSTDGQPYTLTRVALVQRTAGDLAGARETLRDGFRSIGDHPAMRGADGRYHQVALAQLVIGDLDGAQRSIEAMKAGRSGPLSALARAQASTGRVAEAGTTLARAIEEAGREVANPPPRDPSLPKSLLGVENIPAVVRMAYAEIRATAGDVAGAVRTLGSIEESDYRRFALGKIVGARALAGDLAGAVRLGLDLSRTPEERRTALEGVGEGLQGRFALDPPAGPR